MDGIWEQVITNIPNFVGFALLAYVLVRQVERLTDALVERLTALEQRVNTLAENVATQTYERGIDPSRPPHNSRKPSIYSNDDK